MGRLHRRRLEAVFAGGDFPARREKFPVPDYREFEATTAETLGNLGPNSLRGARNRRNSLYFPCLTGISSQRRVRSRLPPPPLSLRLRRLVGRNPRRPGISRDSAGFWDGRFGEPNRRRLGDTPRRLRDAHFLCGRLRRFGYRARGGEFEGADKRCHSFVKDGKVQFLGDCDHALAGQTLEPERASIPRHLAGYRRLR